MIRFERSPEPPEFHERCRVRGNEWLRRNPGGTRPPNYWTEFLPQLAHAFRNLCAYTALHEPLGTVDHYHSVGNRELAYEWSNYRFASSLMNSIKNAAGDAVLDPFEVQDDWFDLDLPSLQVVLLPDVPPDLRERAAFTLQRLRLRDDERFIRLRRSWFELFHEGAVQFEGLRSLAPMIARAIERRIIGCVVENGSVTSSDVVSRCFLNDRIAQQTLDALVAANRLRASEPGRFVLV